MKDKADQQTKEIIFMEKMKKKQRVRKVMTDEPA
jgi:hypothetical protein